MKQASRQWLEVAAEWCQLGAEASVVVPLRLTRLACGGAKARDEAELMVREKVVAHGAVLRDLNCGAFGNSASGVARGVTRHYLVLVRANRRRLVRQMFG